MRNVASLAAVFLLSVGACELSFTEPRRDATARLYLSVSSSDSAAGTVRLDASLSPGLTERGGARRVEDETLTVGGEELLPDRVEANGDRRYRKEWPISTFASGALLSAHPPRVEGAGTPPTVEFRIPRRLGPERFRVPDGAPIQLGLSGVEPPPPGLRDAFWQLTVPEDGGMSPHVNVHTGGFPPGTITIPGEWIPAGAASEIRARLLVAFRTEYPSASDYAITLYQSSLVFWSIQRDGG